ncbi:MAG: ATP-dependent DNA helicase RecG [Elusimicrobiota bacterium]
MQVQNPDLNKEVKYLKGIGPRRAEKFARLGIHTISDLLHYYPCRWESRGTVTSISNINQEGVKVTLCGVVKSKKLIRTHSRMQLYKIMVDDGSGLAEAVWFKYVHGRYNAFARQTEDIVVGKKVFVYGTVQRTLQLVKEIYAEEYEAGVEDISMSLHLGNLVPVYNLTEGLTERFLRETVCSVVMKYAGEIPELLPLSFREKYGLLNRGVAIKNIHFPVNQEIRDKAYRTLVFEEYFGYQLALELERQKIKKTVKPQKYVITRKYLTPFKQGLKFEFTAAQVRVINQIFSDIQSQYPMNRLIQGDVGSGKTVVALSAMLLAAENGYQAAFMAPTEILAEQHYSTFKEFLSPVPEVKFGLLTSKILKSEKEKVLSKLKTGELAFVIGTHALVEGNVEFANLRFVVIDEQHRFGVIQRAKLRAKGKDVDVLVLTATPIPRTLALTLYGDLDVTVIDELPAGRVPIVTMHLPENDAYDFVKGEISRGAQAYIVYPLVEESDKIALKAAVEETERLSSTVFKNYRVGVIHGQLSGREKDRVMNKFRDGEIDVLVATTVIEVGIDVKNATVMVVEHADRYGLATLHQLRGRVGRGDKQSYCILVGQPGNELAQRRLQVMTETNDGFRIAEEDLVLRGPGEFLGTSQHGEAMFRIGDIIADQDILKLSRIAAVEVVNVDPELKDEGFAILRQVVYERYGKKRAALVKVG